MKKRIYFSFLGLILLSILLLSASVSVIFFNVNQNQEKAAVRDRAVLAADLLNRGVGGADVFYNDYANYNADTARVTVVAPNGTVLLDNKADAASLENHGGREEIQQALQAGSGEITRYSITAGYDTYYYAVLLDDGNVLRVSKTMSHINKVFSAVWPAIAAVTVLVLLLANMLARRLTRKILIPLNWIDFEGDNTAAYDELVPYMKKINQQKHEIAAQMTALRSRADTIEIITGNMKEGLILIDRAGTTLIANKSAAELFREEQMEQKHILNICRNMEFQQGVKECLSGGNAEIIFEQDEKTYNVYFSPAQGHDGLTGGVILFFDVTERMGAEKQRREFSANVSHELKTPLTSISALSEMIGNGMAKEDDIKGFAEKISEQAKRLIDVINDIIKLSEFDEGKADRGREVFDLYALAETAAGTLRDNGKGVQIYLSGERFDITANRRMIDELLVNLIDNGIKYNKDGGTVTVTLSRENGFCQIAVSDTGIGIPAAHQSRVFERFYRVDRSRSKKTGGTGLGLSIVKHTAEHHGGRVELKSSEDAGTTVTCWLLYSP